MLKVAFQGFLFSHWELGAVVPALGMGLAGIGPMMFGSIFEARTEVGKMIPFPPFIQLFVHCALDLFCCPRTNEPVSGPIARARLCISRNVLVILTQPTLT